MGQIFTFYSYKGGVGRSMALANISIILSKLGYKTLIVDWDLEAPGIEYFFNDYIDLKEIVKKEGILDLLLKIQNKEIKKLNWKPYSTKISIAGIKQNIDLITSGKKGKDYFSNIRRLEIDKLYEVSGFELESLREEWKNIYDYILIDSRTGITEFGGICTIHLPDILILFFIANEQSLKGIIDVYKKASEGRKNLPFDRTSLISFPILSKFDSSEEFKISQYWITESSNRLKSIFYNWLPKTINTRDFIEFTKIPYIPYFSFGEKLAVIEQGTVDPASIGYAYETIAAIIADSLQSIEEIFENRDEFIRSKNKELMFDRIIKKTHSKIFISYSQEDKYIAEKFFNKLKKEGFEPWLDVKSIKPGEDLQNSIDKAIQKTDLFIVLVSKNIIQDERVKKEIQVALNIAQRKLDKEIFVLPIKIDNSEVPNTLSNFKYLDFSRSIDWDKLLLSVYPTFEEDQKEKHKLIEDKWLDLLEEGNDIKIKRQIYNQKNSIFRNFFEILELDGIQAPKSLSLNFWNSIDNILIQLLSLIKYDIKHYRSNLIDLLYYAYELAAGPNPKEFSDYPEGKQSEIWIGIIIRIYLIGAIALKNGKYEIVKDLIKIRPKWNKYWSKRYWIKHASVMYSRSKKVEDKEGLVALSNKSITNIHWAQLYFEKGTDLTIEYLCSFDLFQCILALHDSKETSSCYPSFGQFYTFRLDNTFIDIVKKKNSYAIVSDIPDNELAKILLELNKYASEEYFLAGGWDSDSLPEEVLEFIDANIGNKKLK